jgi:hypothetical protein
MVPGTADTAAHPEARSPTACPGWCVSPHGVSLGEEDWVHLGEPLTVAEGVRASLCASIEPITGVMDGPYVLVGATEYSLEQAREIGIALVAMTDTGILARAGMAACEPNQEV